MTENNIGNILITCVSTFYANKFDKLDQIYAYYAHELRHWLYGIDYTYICIYE